MTGKFYVSKIDNVSFNTREELIQHLVANFSIESTEGSEKTSFINKLQEAFPFAEINIRECTSGEFGRYQVLMEWKEYDTEFYFYLGKYEEEEHYGSKQFVTVEEAIAFYQNFLTKKDEVIASLQKKYRPEKIRITKMYGGGYVSLGGISFEFIKNGVEYGDYYKNGMEVEVFTEQFQGNFKDCLEGEIVLEKDSSTESEVEYWVDGVRLSGLLKRAKKVRVELLEPLETK